MSLVVPSYLVDPIVLILQIIVVLAVIRFIIIGQIGRLLWPRIHPFLRRVGAYPSYRRAAKKGRLTIPLRIVSHHVYERDTRRFDKFFERRFGGLTEAFSLVLDKSIGIFGASGQGKTELIKSLVYTFRKHPSDIPLIIFDTKGEFETFLERDDLFGDVEVVKLSVTDSTRPHNILKEARDVEEFREIVKSIFAPPSGTVEGGGHPFFSNSAVHLLESMVRCYVDRTDFSKDGNRMTTHGFLEFLHRHDADTMQAIVKAHPDSSVASAAEYINPKSERQQIGVFSTIMKDINNVFVGDFIGSEDDTIEDTVSIREFFNDPGNRVLLISRPPECADSVDMMYRFFLDRGMKLALSDEWPATFVYDEFASVPPLRYISDLASKGRAQNAIGIFGTQDISQLEDEYGDAGARSIMSSMTQQVFLGTNSSETAQYASEQIGTHTVMREGTKTTEGGETIHGTWPVEERIVKPSKFDRWDRGEAACKAKRAGGRRVAVGVLSKFSKVRRKIRRAAKHFPGILGAGERVEPPYLAHTAPTETPILTTGETTKSTSDQTEDAQRNGQTNGSSDIQMTDAEKALHTGSDGGE